MHVTKIPFAAYLSALLLVAATGDGLVLADEPDDKAWVRITEDDSRIKIETDKLEAVIPRSAYPVQ